MSRGRSMRPHVQPMPGAGLRRRCAEKSSAGLPGCCARRNRGSPRSSRPKRESPGRTRWLKSRSSADLGVFMQSETSRLYGKTMTSPIPNRTVYTVRQPMGICAAIMPFNSPLAGVAWKVFPALACGNAVVAKSHELTPYTAVAFGRAAARGGRAARRVLGRAGPRRRGGHAARQRRSRGPRQLHRGRPRPEN